MSRAATIEAVGVVVPAHNEETLLPACLMALRRAVNAVGIPVQLLVVADTCTDQTAATAIEYGLIAALIAVVIVVASLASKLSSARGESAAPV